MTAAKAVDLLRPSRLKQTQLELMGDDIDLSNLYLALNHKDIDIIAAVEDVVIARTIQGASTITVTVLDRDRVLLKSGRLSARNDIEIDGLFFRLVSVAKDGSTLTLVFEDREIAVLRLYNKPIKQALSTSRHKVTRAQFVLRLIREPRELKIDYFIPELNKVQPLVGGSASDKTTQVANRNLGIPKVNDLTVKGQPMTDEQRNNANGVLDTGRSMLVPRKALVMSMMAVIQESTIRNLTGGDLDSVGLFQQRKSQGWPASRNVSTDATAFFQHLMNYLSSHADPQYWVAVQAVQISANGQLYAQWRTEAERIVTAYGVLDGTAAAANSQFSDTTVDTTDYEFYRGIPPTQKKTQWGKESSWDCINRLAQEVNWRAFFVSGRFYFLADDDLIKSKPLAVIDEDSDGIDAIDGTYDEGAKSAGVSVTCRMSKWAAPPGSVVQLKNLGPWNGRWIVNDISRSAFARQGTITLKKKLPRLPEPAGGNLGASSSAAAGTWTGAPAPTDGPVQFKTPGGFVQPVPAGHNNAIIGGQHETAGLPGYPAYDFGADAGSPVIAVESGKIVKLSGHDPANGPADPLMGVHGPFGWSVYLLGDSGSEYYYTHLGTRSALLNQRVNAGQELGTIGDYARWGGANHVHVGVHQGGHGPTATDLSNADLAGR